MRALVAVVCTALLPSFCFAATIYVPDHYPRIQDAIVAAVNGDKVIVRPGTYVENIDFIGKAITVQSEQGVGVTTIDGNKSGSVVSFVSGETAASILEGFTIVNGSGSPIGSGTFGGGVYCGNYSSPVIKKNRIVGNKVGRAGGGIFCDEASPIITSNFISGNSSKDGGGVYCGGAPATITINTITRNSVSGDGGGVYCNTSSSTINNNIVSENSAFDNGGGLFFYYSTPIVMNNIISNNTAIAVGGGVLLSLVTSSSSSTITNNTIVDNSASFGGGIYCYEIRRQTITNTVFWNNSAQIGKEIGISYNLIPFTVTVRCCDVEGGRSSCYKSPGCGLNWGSGMIDADPLFADPANNDLHLTWPSPCRNAGDKAAVSELYDFEGDPRIAGGTVDMGADEFYYHLYSVGDVLPGSPIDMKIVGIPGLPTLLALGAGIQDPPQSTQHGDLWLKLPIAKSWQLGTVPATGILTHTATVPSGWPSGSTHPFQALVGPWGGAATLLTNVHLLEVE